MSHAVGIFGLQAGEDVKRKFGGVGFHGSGVTTSRRLDGVISCPTCALPSPLGLSNGLSPSPNNRLNNCAFCGDELPTATPWPARIVPTGTGLLLSAAGRALAVAEPNDELWKLSTGEPSTLCQSREPNHFTLAALTIGGKREWVMFDEGFGVVMSLRHVGLSGLAGNTATAESQTTLLHNAEERLVAIVRPDGSGGLHAMAPDGNVLLFAGRSAPDGQALDLLITQSGMALPLVIFFGLFVALDDEGSSGLIPGSGAVI